jgi:hypothetical protein
MLGSTRASRGAFDDHPADGGLGCAGRSPGFSAQMRPRFEHAAIPRQSAPCRLDENLIPSLLMCRIPCWQGKMQGISSIQPFFARIRLENKRKISSLPLNSLRAEQGIN